MRVKYIENNMLCDLSRTALKGVAPPPPQHARTGRAGDPYGLESFLAIFPALTRWATLASGRCRAYRRSSMGTANRLVKAHGANLRCVWVEALSASPVALEHGQ